MERLVDLIPHRPPWLLVDRVARAQPTASSRRRSWWRRTIRCCATGSCRSCCCSRRWRRRRLATTPASSGASRPARGGDAASSFDGRARAGDVVRAARREDRDDGRAGALHRRGARRRAAPRARRDDLRRDGVATSLSDSPLARRRPRRIFLVEEDDHEVDAGSVVAGRRGLRLSADQDGGVPRDGMPADVCFVVTGGYGAADRSAAVDPAAPAPMTVMPPASRRWCRCRARRRRPAPEPIVPAPTPRAVKSAMSGA